MGDGDLTSMFMKASRHVLCLYNVHVREYIVTISIVHDNDGLLFQGVQSSYIWLYYKDIYIYMLSTSIKNENLYARLFRIHNYIGYTFYIDGIFTQSLMFLQHFLYELQTLGIFLTQVQFVKQVVLRWYRGLCSRRCPCTHGGFHAVYVCHLSIIWLASHQGAKRILQTTRRRHQFL